MNKPIDWDKVNEKKRKAAERRRQRLVSPEYREKQAEKRRASIERQQERAKARLNDPERRRALAEKHREQQERQRERQREKARADFLTPSVYPKDKPVKSKRKNSKGLKGRTPNATEKRIMNLIGTLPCVCCLKKGSESLDNHQHGPVTLHHVEGRTKTWAHAKVLPLCQYHHDVPAPAGAPIWLFPIHGTGRKPWEAENGTQADLLVFVYQLIGESQPWIN